MREATLPITVLVAVKNEAVNIEKCLRSLAPAEKVIVADSQSTDGTEAIALSAGAEVVQFHYSGGYPKKRQWVLDSGLIRSPWTMLVDADEVIPPELWAEIARVISHSPAAGYLVRKGFHFLGRRFRYGGFSHQAILLFPTGKGRFEQTLVEDPSGLDMEVHERVIVDAPVQALATPLVHEDFKGLEAYIARHNKYSTWEARLRHEYVRTGRYGAEAIEPRLFGDAQQRRRFLKRLAIRVPFEPLLWFIYHYFLRLGFMEGRRGLIACQIRADYIRQVRAKLYELQLREARERT